MPASIRGGFQGTAAAYELALSGQVVLIFAALIAVYLVLGILYESFIVPITILSTLPSAGLGALLILNIGEHAFGYYRYHRHRSNSSVSCRRTAS